MVAVSVIELSGFKNQGEVWVVGKELDYWRLGQWLLSKMYECVGHHSSNIFVKVKGNKKENDVCISLSWGSGNRYEPFTNLIWIISAWKTRKVIKKISFHVTLLLCFVTLKKYEMILFCISQRKWKCIKGSDESKCKRCITFNEICVPHVSRKGSRSDLNHKKNKMNNTEVAICAEMSIGCC